MIGGSSGIEGVSAPAVPTATTSKNMARSEVFIDVGCGPSYEVPGLVRKGHLTSRKKVSLVSPQDIAPISIVVTSFSASVRTKSQMSNMHHSETDDLWSWACDTLDNTVNKLSFALDMKMMKDSKLVIDIHDVEIYDKTGEKSYETGDPLNTVFVVS